MRAISLVLGLSAIVLSQVSSAQVPPSDAVMQMQQKLYSGNYSEQTRARILQAATAFEVDRQQAEERRARMRMQSPADRIASYGFGDVKMAEQGFRPRLSPGASFQRRLITGTDNEVIEEIFYFAMNISPVHAGSFGTVYFGGGSDKSSVPFLFDSSNIVVTDQNHSIFTGPGYSKFILLNGNAMASALLTSQDNSSTRKTFFRGELPSGFAYAVSFKPTFCSVAGEGTFKIYTGYGFLKDEDIRSIQMRLDSMDDPGVANMGSGGVVTSELLSMLNADRLASSKYGVPSKYTPKSEKGKKVAANAMEAMRETSSARGDQAMATAAADAALAKSRAAGKVREFDYAEGLSYMNGAKAGNIWRLNEVYCEPKNAGG